MADNTHINDLLAFKSKLVENRRAIVRHEVDAVNRGGDVLTDKFIEIQAQIDAVDRAIEDEKKVVPK